MLLGMKKTSTKKPGAKKSEVASPLPTCNCGGTEAGIREAAVGHLAGCPLGVDEYEVVVSHRAGRPLAYRTIQRIDGRPMAEVTRLLREMAESLAGRREIWRPRK